VWLPRFFVCTLILLFGITANVAAQQGRDEIQSAHEEAEQLASADALGLPVKGKFVVLTDQLYDTSSHHISDKLSLPGYYRWKQDLSGDKGVDFVLLNTPIFQIGSDGGESYLDNEMDFYALWRAFEGDTDGEVFFWGQWVQVGSDMPTKAFSISQGLLTQANSGLTDPDKSFVAPSALWWEQRYKRSGLSYRAGQLYAASLWGSNDYLGDDRSTFLNTVMSTNQGVPWSDRNRGVGAMATISGSSLYLSAGFQDAQADQTRIDVSSFTDAEYTYLVELGYTPSLGGSKGVYKINYGLVDKAVSGDEQGDGKGRGLAISLRQDIGERYAVFATYRESWERYIDNIKLTASAGMIWNRPLHWGDDQAGFSVFYAKPELTYDGVFQSEYGVEAFWRLQLTPRFDIAPDIQLYLQPGQKAQSGVVTVAGLRLRYIL